MEAFFNQRETGGAPWNPICLHTHRLSYFTSVYGVDEYMPFVLYFSRISWMMGHNERGGNEVCIGSVKFTFNIFHFLKFVHILNIYFILKLDFLDHPYNHCPKISYINKIIDRTTNFQKKDYCFLTGTAKQKQFPSKYNEIKEVLRAQHFHNKS